MPGERRTLLLTDAVLSVPEHMWEQIFCNKKILRRAFQNEIVRELAERPKIPLYYGKGEIHTAGMMLKLITRNGYELIDYAFPSRDACPWINQDNLVRYVDNVSRDPAHTHWEKVVRLFNIGILSRMHHAVG